MPNKRIQEVMKAHNIKPFKLPPKNSHPVKLDGIHDPRLPKQIAQELSQRDDVVEIHHFPAALMSTHEEYRVKLLSGDAFNTFIFYTSTK